MQIEQSPKNPLNGPRPTAPPWPLLAAVAGAFVLRVPMILGAADIIDSDAAVNGLALKHLVEGRWHWHYPGMHYMGVTELLLALPAALVFGATPATLTTGPVLAFGLLLIAAYTLVKRLYGAKAALWSLVPLVFCSSDVLFWTSFPIGGHGLITFWHVTALLMLAAYLRSGKLEWLFVLGVWSGFGYYTYQMFLFSLVLIGPVVLFARAGTYASPVGQLGRMLMGGGQSGGGKNVGVSIGRPLLSLLLPVLGFLIGWVPHWIGWHVEPHDVYGSQLGLLDAASSPGDLWSNLQALVDQGLRLAWLNLPVLMYDCLPKFVTGHTLSGLADGGLLVQTVAAVIVGLWLFVGVRYYTHIFRELLRSGRAAPRDTMFPIQLIIAATPPLVLAGFVIHPAVSNENHTRYLIYLISWLPVAFGLTLRRLTDEAGGRPQQPVPHTNPAAGPAGDPLLRRVRPLLPAWVAGLWILASGSALGTYIWGFPHGRFRDADVLRYLKTQQSFEYFYAWYWDAYRMTFVTDERVKGIPTEDLHVIHPLRLPEYEIAARKADRVGVVVRKRKIKGRRGIQERPLPRWRPPAGVTPVYEDEYYTVFSVPAYLVSR